MSTGGTPLSLDAIQALLNSDKKKPEAHKSTLRERPVQAGLLRWSDKTKPCTSRGCRAPALIRIHGAPYCTTHALNVLNMECMKLDGTWEKYNLDSCDCNAGKHSRQNIHGEGCPVFNTIRSIESSDNDSSNSGDS
jgi:hypothetical protein